MNKYTPEIFVGCSTEILAAAKAIQNNLQHFSRVTIWTQDTFGLSRVTIHEIQSAALKADYAVFILAPDDRTISREKELYAPRDNTIFETGFFMGVLGIEKVFILKPKGFDIKLPTDLLGITPALYESPEDGRWEAALGPASNKIEMEIRKKNRNVENNSSADPKVGPHKVYTSMKAAATDVKAECHEASDIKILSNKGFTFLATDNSILSTAEIKKFKNLRKLRVLLLSPRARWITNGLISTRGYRTVDSYVKEVVANQKIVEIGFDKFAKILTSNRSGIRYYDGEPYWRIIMTERSAYVSSYADDPKKQVQDLPVARFDNVPFSFYHVFKRYFNDIWHNQGSPSNHLTKRIAYSVSAGGIVYTLTDGAVCVALLRRSDGYWVLPKGHIDAEDKSLENTACREVSEELGIDASKLKIENKLSVYEDKSFEDEGEAKIVHIYAIRYIGSRLCELNPDIDHEEAVWWHSSDNIPEMLYIEQKEILSNFLKSIDNSLKCVPLGEED